MSEVKIRLMRGVEGVKFEGIPEEEQKKLKKLAIKLQWELQDVTTGYVVEWNSEALEFMGIDIIDVLREKEYAIFEKVVEVINKTLKQLGFKPKSLEDATITGAVESGVGWSVGSFADPVAEFIAEGDKYRIDVDTVSGGNVQPPEPNTVYYRVKGLTILPAD